MKAIVEYAQDNRTCCLMNFKSSQHIVCLALYRPVAVRKEGNQQNEPSTIPEDAGEVQRSEATSPAALLCW